MKKIIITYLFVFIIATIVRAEFDVQMQSANQLYEQNKFNDAYTIYKQLADAGNYSYELFYNLGATYYQLDSVAPSIYYLEKAKQIKSKDADLEHNLSLAYGRQQDDVDKFPELFVVSFLKKLSGIFSSNLWLILSVLSLWATAVIYYFKDQKRGFLFEKSRWMFPLIFGLFSFVMAYLHHFYNEQGEQAIVFQFETDIRKGANADAESIITIHEGLKLTILDEVDEWIKVKMSDNTIGWLKKSAVKRI